MGCAYAGVSLQEVLFITLYLGGSFDQRGLPLTTVSGPLIVDTIVEIFLLIPLQQKPISVLRAERYRRNWVSNPMSPI